MKRPGITECQIINWFVQPGDRVEQFDKISEVQSDKALVEVLYMLFNSELIKKNANLCENRLPRALTVQSKLSITE